MEFYVSNSAAHIVNNGTLHGNNSAQCHGNKSSPACVSWAPCPMWYYLVFGKLKPKLCKLVGKAKKGRPSKKII